jgi:hypothetical protein
MESEFPSSNRFARINQEKPETRGLRFGLVYREAAEVV